MTKVVAWNFSPSRWNLFSSFYWCDASGIKRKNEGTQTRVRDTEVRGIGEFFQLVKHVATPVRTGSTTYDHEEEAHNTTGIWFIDYKDKWITYGKMRFKRLKVAHSLLKNPIILAKIHQYKRKLKKKFIELKQNLSFR